VCTAKADVATVIDSITESNSPAMIRRIEPSLRCRGYTSGNDHVTIGLNGSQLLILTIGMTFLIGAGHLDLSIGSNLILSSVVAARVVVAVAGSADQVAAREYPNLALAVPLGVAAGIGFGGLAGLLNGMLASR
jgi:ribose transport system permease protein